MNPKLMEEMARIPEDLTGCVAHRVDGEGRSPRAAGAAALVGGVLLAACGAEVVPAEPGPLTAAGRWTWVEAAEDPFDDRPPTFPCVDRGWDVEGLSLEVETDLCTYVTVVQPSLRRLVPGDQLVFTAWHQALSATEPASAHIELRLGSRTLFVERPAIPQPPRIYDLSAIVEEHWPEGTPIYLHVHNHGGNSYGFSELELRAAPPQ